MMATQESIGERIQRLRKAAGMTQAELAAAASLNLGALRNYEQGIREPKVVAVGKLALALKVSSDVIIGIRQGDQP